MHDHYKQTFDIFLFDIDFDNSSIIDKGSFHIRETFEAWHTSATKHADNNSKPLPNQYSILFKQSLVYTDILCFCSLHCFNFTFFCIYFIISQSILSVEGCRLTAESSFYFLNFLASKRFYVFESE